MGVEFGAGYCLLEWPEVVIVLLVTLEAIDLHTRAGLHRRIRPHAAVGRGAIGAAHDGLAPFAFVKLARLEASGELCPSSRQLIMVVALNLNMVARRDINSQNCSRHTGPDTARQSDHDARAGRGRCHIRVPLAFVPH